MEDRLVLAQVIHLIGASDWQNVSSSLMRMSTDRGKQIVLTPAECEAYWSGLMRQTGANLHDPSVQERVRAPQAPENLDLVKRLFLYRLTELHHQILEKENAFRQLSNELTEIRSGTWDEKLAPKKPQPEPVVSVPAATVSSSSSQLSSIDSPVPPLAAPATQQESRDDMEVDDADITITQQHDQMDANSDEEKPGSPTDGSPVAGEEAKDKSKGKGQVQEDDEDEDAEEDDDDDDEEKEVEKARPTRGLRSRKAPVLEPLEIPAATTSSRKGKGHKTSDSTSQPSARGRRRAGPESVKPPHSPATVSVAGTFESAATPAATDENASVMDEGGRRRSTRGHKRKASEMDVDLPVLSLSKKIRDRSTTVEDEPMTPAVPSGSSGRFVNPKLKQSMTRIVTLLNSNKHAEIFRRPVTKKEAPDYAKAVQTPTDLTTIQRAIKAGQIVSWDELERELRRMLANCCVYNRPGTGAYETAKLMLNEIEQMLEVAREGAGDGK